MTADERMTGDEKMPTIRRDVLYVYERLEHARDLIDPKKNRKAWNELDLAIGRMQGLSFFVGPWKDDSPPEDPNKAAKAVADQVAALTEDTGASSKPAKDAPETSDTD